VARRSGGPRSSEIKPEEVDDYRNLILLCQTHHKEIDDQPQEYTIENLREIKRKHEQWVDETLEMRAALPDDFWEKIKEEAEELVRSIDGKLDPKTIDFLESLGFFSLMTAELLATPELVFFLRSNETETSLAFKHDHGRTLFAHGDDEGFHGGFAAFGEAATIEDRSSEVRTYREDEQASSVNEEIFLLATSALLTIAEKTSSSEAVLYLRDPSDIERGELAFRVLDGSVVQLGVGPAGSFKRAYRSFDRHDPADKTQAIQLKRVADFYGEAMAQGDTEARLGFIANYFGVSVLAAVDGLAKESEREEKEIFARLTRNCFYEALLMLKAADRSSDDPRVKAWGEKHADPEAEDGYSSVLPNSCRKAVTEYGQLIELDEDRQAELEEASIALLFEATNLLRRVRDDKDAQDAVVSVTVERIEWWGEPEARPEVREMVGLEGEI
jgi:hypothetical protein